MGYLKLESWYMSMAFKKYQNDGMMVKMEMKIKWKDVKEYLRYFSTCF